ncbi:YihY/virulence factor BrkB family protein [Aquimarina addita]|uniref:YihY/virulence factor BrkB family protein n=1 Tax=Aquimarina addita TaxID=870485 RepID=A0ABP7X856_9FLAO
MKKVKFKTILNIIIETYKNWSANDPFQLSAAVSYYALFSFPALLIIVIQTAGVFYEESEIKGKIINEIGAVLGKDSAQTIETMITNAIDQDQTGIAIIIGIATLLYGATGMFIALQRSLNIIWGVKPNPKNEYLKMIRDRVFSLGLILIIGFLLLTSLVLTALITAVINWAEQFMPDFMIQIIQILNFVVSLALITVLFALIFKILPDVKMRWRDVWLGSFVTALLFSLGKSGLGIYFGTANPGSTFGAAGSIILILLWVSYSSLILFFGAELTQVLAAKYGSGIKPSPYAEEIS